MRDRVVIALVNFNGYQDTIECLESVLKLSHAYFNIVVVDNSTNDSWGAFRNWSRDGAAVETSYKDLVFPLVEKPLPCFFLDEGEDADWSRGNKQIIFIRAKSNKGFAAGNNLAMKFIKQLPYDFVWLLNNDTVVEPDTLTALLLTASLSNAKTGMWGSKLMAYHNPEIIQGLGGRYNKWTGKVTEVGSGEEDKGQWDAAAFSFDYVIGASMFARREFIEDVGFMEEDYFLYYEELDWAIRGVRRGWMLGVSPASRVFHKMGASINSGGGKVNSRLSDFYSARNRILLTKKYFPFALVTLYPSFIKFVINRIRLKQYSRILMLFKIILDPYRHF